MGALGFLRPLGQTWTVLAAIILIISGLTALAGSIPGAQALFVTSALMGFAGGLIWSATAGARLIARAAEASAYVMLMWLMTPLFFALPFLWLAPELSYVDAFFEAYSAFTTTGAVILEPERTNDVLIFWRCLLSFLGGYMTLLTAAGVLAAFDKAGLELRKSVLLTVDRENIFSNLHVAARRIAILYSTLALLGFSGFLVTGVPVFEALCLALSGLSTGGYTLTSDALVDQIPITAIGWLSILSIAGALNIAYIISVFNRQANWNDGDLVMGGVLVLALTLIFVLAVGEPSSLLAAFVDAIFVLTTSGVTAVNSAGYAPLAAVLFAMIGGAAASTAGGLKVSRLVILSRGAVADLARMASPSSVVNVKYRGKSTENPAMLALWATVLSYIGLVAISVVALTLFGEPFDAAWSAASTAISNAGPLHNQLSVEYSWSDLTAPSLIYSAMLMVLGRLEVLAGLAAIVALIRRF